jgi:penicillin-binding protein 2
VVPYSAVRVRTDVPRSVLNFLRERRTAYPGVEAAEVYVRKYPQRTLAAQLLGTVGEVSPDQLKKRKFRGVKQGTVVGQEGLEVEYDRYLRGQDGSRRIQVDAFGNPKGRLRELDPRSGNQLKLSLDLDLQRAGQNALSGSANAGNNPAAFVAMNPRNGEVLAMGSYPSFDPNVLSGRPLTQRQVDRLFGEEAGAPRFNRAISGLYPTASTFKAISATAALHAGVIGVGDAIQDAGCTRIGTREACNAGKVANGPVAVRRALQVSSDIYFYRVGVEMFGARDSPLQTWTKRLGVGRKTGIDLPGEFKGLIPDQKWRTQLNRREEKCRPTNNGKPCFAIDIRPYNVGDNANLAVGQGEMQATPLQMAVAYSTLAMNGRVPRPHVGLEIQNGQGESIQRIEREAARRVKLKPEFREAVMSGLRAAAMEPGGTSYDVFDDWPRDLPVYGKTGTAERPPKPDQSWYVAYVPGGRGKSPIVVAATVESCGCFGAEAAAPITRLILSQHFGVKKKIVKGSSATR